MKRHPKTNRRPSARSWVAVATTLCALPASARQTWVPTGTIENLHSGKCLDVAGGSTVSYANVQQFSCHGGSSTEERVGARFPQRERLDRIVAAAPRRRPAAAGARAPIGVRAAPPPCQALRRIARPA